ncbi:dipeptidyl aminopeptidase/acylaminoacyl peptidase [Kibdelosporangium banguiense]|uniref:Dipeptidyl aminopeptidase/acylaminoacyl peptidase n=1 Tax=Kibdelosporangium banguiense TaxID=1365924 RepID=A0ABS4TJD0_9PSEU|nr:S9 family peptidase [Kibdelosporangium banguiense]MBP2324523.1 dipeptidyl aminopeptidase/acylaminoacyl peptidase [Kibdelosporangium banguiense]
MRPGDIELLTVPDSVSLRGELLLVAATRPVLADNTYLGGLHRVALDGSGTRPWTYGYSDAAPEISPDGKWVAFLRRTSTEDRPQLYVQPTDGGDARALTKADDLPLGVQAPVWSPDSGRIAFLARIPQQGRYSSSVPAQSESFRRITRLDYRWDDVGFILDRLPRLFVTDLAGEVTELAGGAADIGRPAWTPDGAYLVVAAPPDWADSPQTQRRDVFAIPASGGSPNPVVRTEGDAFQITAGDGFLVFTGRSFDGDFTAVANTGLWTAPFTVDKPATARRLTDVESVDCEDITPQLTDSAVLFGVSNRGAVELRSVALSGESVTLADTELLAGARGKLKDFAVDGSRVVTIVSTPDSTGRVEFAGTVLADFSEPLRASGLCEIREIDGESPDGYPSHGWVVLPEGPGPHPVLLAVHGGPYAFHGWGFFDEAQVYASAGYAVVLPNPRGSASYGEAHGRAIVHAFGTVDVDDVLSVLDKALELPELDSSRVGVMGGSYGGFMTSWLAAHHGQRFRAAWSERAVNAWDSFSGSSDIGWGFTESYVGTDLETQLKTSPLTHAGQIRIPFAVVHSEHDWRCPVEQGQRMFVALHRQGTPVEFLLFPGEGHELTRSGQPRHRAERFEAVLEWWSRHLG